MARGVPVRLLSPLFAVLIALTTALAVPIVGAIIVLSVMSIPGAAAARVTANPLVATLLAVLFAELALVGGTVLSLAPGLPVSGLRRDDRVPLLRSGVAPAAAPVRGNGSLERRLPRSRAARGGGPPPPAPRPRPRRR